jgi:hypothetical protein
MPEKGKLSLKVKSEQSKLSYDECKARGLPTCQAGRDGECNYISCPQNLEGEPMKTGRHCPWDWDWTKDE